MTTDTTPHYKMISGLSTNVVRTMLVKGKKGREIEIGATITFDVPIRLEDLMDLRFGSWVEPANKE
jgi:hypothetical protein